MDSEVTVRRRDQSQTVPVGHKSRASGPHSLAGPTGRLRLEQVFLGNFKVTLRLSCNSVLQVSGRHDQISYSAIPYNK